MQFMSGVSSRIARMLRSGSTNLTVGSIVDGEYLKRSGSSIISAAVSGSGVPQALAGGRLTLSTGTPVTTSDLSSQSTLYYALFGHDVIGNYNGSSWDAVTFTELSLALSGLTSGKNYDAIFYRNGGSNTLDLMPAWTNDTTRASAIARQNGVWTNSGSITTVINGHSVSANRGTLLGTIRTTGTTTTEDSATKRFVWNARNRVLRFLNVVDTTDSWTYTTDTIRQVRATSTNQVEYVCGLSEDLVVAIAQAACSNSGGVNNVFAGVGVDSTSASSAQVYAGRSPSALIGTGVGQYSGFPGLGYHFLAWLERSNQTSGTTTWYGDIGTTGLQTGMQAWVMA